MEARWNLHKAFLISSSKILNKGVPYINILGNYPIYLPCFLMSCVDVKNVESILWRYFESTGEGLYGSWGVVGGVLKV